MFRGLHLIGHHAIQAHARGAHDFQEDMTSNIERSLEAPSVELLWRLHHFFFNLVFSYWTMLFWYSLFLNNFPAFNN